MSASIATWYWIICLMVFTYWSILFYADYSTSKLDFVSWCILLVAPLLWPIVLPISSWELSRKALHNILL